MVPQPAQLFSPSELAYLQSSLSLDPPIRPDGRSPTTFRPLSAETDFLPSANGSARLCFADGTEAIVGVKAEVQKSGNITSQIPAAAGLDRGASLSLSLPGLSVGKQQQQQPLQQGVAGQEREYDMTEGGAGWVEVTIDIPGQRDDDNTIVFLAQMILEGLMVDGYLERRLRINSSWHWKLYIDILLLSPPQSYPLPLISLSTHLALLNTSLPALLSRGDEDPLFDDDWAAALPIYTASHSPQQDQNPPFTTTTTKTTITITPPITLLLTHHAPNTILFDPSAAELAVADAVVAITIAPSSSAAANAHPTTNRLRILSLRTLDPPSRLYAADNGAIVSAEGTAGAGAGQAGADSTGGSGFAGDESTDTGWWRPARGGVKRTVLKKMVGMCVEGGGVGEEILKGLMVWAG